MPEDNDDQSRKQAHKLQVGAYWVLALGVITCAVLGALGHLSEDNVVRGVFGSLAIMVYLLTRGGSPPKLLTTLGISAAAGETAPALLDMIRHIGAGAVLAVTLGGCTTSAIEKHQTAASVSGAKIELAGTAVEATCEAIELDARDAPDRETAKDMLAESRPWCDDLSKAYSAVAAAHALYVDSIVAAVDVDDGEARDALLRHALPLLWRTVSMWSELVAVADRLDLDVPAPPPELVGLVGEQ